MHRVMVRNPASSDRRGSDRAREIARERGFEVLDTTSAGDAVRLAREAADRAADLVVACGGDGTVNEVVWGVDRAGRLPETTLGVVPTGAGNGFAEDIGIATVRQAFDVLDAGEERRLDLGVADGRPFLKTVVGGFPAGVSAYTSTEMKALLGVVGYGLGALPYVLDAVREADVDLLPSFRVRVGPGADPEWEGPAVLALVGNSRQFPGLVWRQAPMEDGLLEVVLVKRLAAFHGVRRTTGPAHRFETPHLLRVRSRELEIEAAETTTFSLDGEILDRRRLSIAVRPRAARFRVGEQYAP